MATARSYFIPGFGYLNETKGNSFLIPNWGYVNQTVTGPGPASTPYIIGSSMVKQGTSLLKQGSTPLIAKGTAYDPLDIIPWV
jgi:hypothetical protein